MLRLLLRKSILGLVGLLLLSIFTAQASSVRVPQSSLGRSSRAITANDLKPSQCAGLNLAAVSGNGINGTATLILGTSALDTLTGASASDCIVGGGGFDFLNGNSGAQTILIAGTGGGWLQNAAICYAPAGAFALFSNCGTIIRT